MRIRWTGVFKNVRAGKRYPPFFTFTQDFFEKTAKEFKEAKEEFVKAMRHRGMHLWDQEILDIEDGE